MASVLVSEPFHDLKSSHLRLVSEAAKIGPVTLCLWTDELIQRQLGQAPRFPFEERRYFWESCRYVSKITSLYEFASTMGGIDVEGLPRKLAQKYSKKPLADHWVMPSGSDTPERLESCASDGMKSVVIPESVLTTFPDPPACPVNPKSNRKKIIVTGCFDLFHTGHVRFFEEVSELGDLYVCVGHDANIRLLKGEGRPLFPQSERCFTTGSMKFVTQSLVTSGDGWLDAEPEIEILKPDAYAVNEDGHKPDKQEYCAKHGIEYIVLKREPKPGLTRRSSTDLRGF